ncbi:MAG TPA: cytochrome oxidase subunit III [Saprospiraceae bacterium]|nr:cytochrome oxidase subunit III [Saprospiraceae bacterium]
MIHRDRIDYRNKIHPHKLALWVALGSILMMFVALTSAYVVKRAAGNWLDFELPQIFYYNTFVILLSSVFLQMSYKGFLKGKENIYKYMLVAAFVTGLAFVVLQYKGWTALHQIGIELSGNPSGSFIYVISGFHALHVLGGIVALILALVFAFKLPYKPTYKRKNRFELVLHYWHFIGFLWVYLLLFLFTQ